MDTGFFQWAAEHGATGVLTLVCMGLSYAVVRLHRAHQECQNARVEDMRAFIEAADRLHDKIHKTSADLASVVEVRRRDRR